MPLPAIEDIPVVRAAGILFVSSSGRILLMHRIDKAAQDGVERGLWAFPGGGIEGEETAEEAARREILEETGVKDTGDLKLWTRRAKDGVDFTTFLARSAEEFEPTLNDEHDAYQWVHRDFALSSGLLHPGCYIALRRFDIDELGIAKAIRDGELTSPQRYENLFLVALRITGTGASYRTQHKEYVWRDPSLYMNPEFLERCNGLPVLFEHPKSNMLNSNEFRDRIVGIIFVSYFRESEQEVWGIAKIFDTESADLLETEEMSTSPGVLCLGDKLPMSNGKKILIESKPELFDHLSLCKRGVWDKGGPPSGVDSVDAQSVNDYETLDLILRNVKLNEISHRIG